MLPVLKERLETIEEDGEIATSDRDEVGWVSRFSRLSQLFFVLSLVSLPSSVFFIPLCLCLALYFSPLSLLFLFPFSPVLCFSS